MTCALDTNLLVYAHGLNGERPRKQAQALLDQVVGFASLPPQVVVEIYNVLTRKAGYAAEAAREASLHWREQFPLVEVAADAAVLTALELAARHQLSVWDALVVAAAELGGCTLLLSEELQHGFRWRGLTVVNPFLTPPHPRLTALLAQGR